MRFVNKHDILIIARNSGLLMIGIGVMCLVPILIDLAYLEFNFAWFLLPGLISILAGLICTKALEKYTLNKIRLKHGMITSALVWLWASIIGGLIFHFVTGINIVDGIFESMSALTGSGITIYPDVEILPHSILFFRAFQQWIGGLGIIVLIISFLSKPGTASSKLYQSEAREDRLKPSIKATIKETFKIYLIYTVAGIVLYTLAGMPFFDSVCHTFSIISTGGMSVKNANIGFYHNDLINLITIVLMILGATSFLVQYRVIKSRGKSLINDLQFKVMISLIAGTTLLIYFISNIVPMDILFHIVSAITTTGASIQSSTVMEVWPANVLIIIMTLMIIGGSNGSTVGALKLMRVITFFKGVYKSLRGILSPNSVINLEISGKKLSDNVVAESGNYITLYLICILISWILLCSYGHDPFNSLFFAISMQGNVGLEIGQMSQSIELPLKVVGIFAMWIGRLEIYPVLITFRAFFEVFKR
ncbi:TrkH family potassium uptake protein [Methanobrevibacter sp.]|uniref:TrkH family potassium uptake protein n=1 Tax=Methanobrevibacter sp. TaxID=66852 RepID=UPI00386A6592